ncbi:MAG: ATP-dependent DNA helicase [Burkholderiaceae bacterium]
MTVEVPKICASDGSSDSPALYHVAVRQLCEFAARQGDLDSRFTPAPTSLQGMEGHAEVAARRGTAYQRELTLAGVHRHLQVRGRADGYDAGDQRVEEIKTHRGDLARMPANHRALHWAQVKVYAHLLCARNALPQVEAALVYFDIASRQETVLVERQDSAALASFHAVLCERFLGWADQELAHRSRRDALLGALPFPHPQFRPGQRALAAAVYRAAVNGSRVLAQAPTGIGKTVATLFPALKACATQRIDKVFFLTAKTTGRQLALDAMRLITHTLPPGALRVLELLARDKACAQPGRECHGESCPLAKGFYDRLADARQALLAEAVWDHATLQRVGLAHSVCPYYLGHEMVQWSDVVIGDYNHYFSSHAMLYALTVGRGWRVSLLVDEAHNLIERARAMYTAELCSGRLREVQAGVPKSLAKHVQQLRRSFSALANAQTERYAVCAQLPEKFTLALQQFSSAAGNLLTEQPGALDAHALRFYFDALQFLQITQTRGSHTLCDLSLLRDDSGPNPRVLQSTLCLRNVVPGPHLDSRWSAAHCAVLFSATLSPARFVNEMLGLGDAAVCLDVPSPFAGQLQVRIARHISTRYRDRVASLRSVVDLMAAQFGSMPGNYLAFFSSFDYLHQAAQLLNELQPHLATWAQSRQMTEGQRQQFLERFTPQGQGIGFAVLGGAFAEGIDLPGSRLSGAFIATLGLPQVNAVNEQMLRQVHACVGNGYNYTYLYPGIQKVVQAAGRVIRRAQDRGTVHLIDDRFDLPDVRALLPAWWSIEEDTVVDASASKAVHSALPS